MLVRVAISRADAAGEAATIPTGQRPPRLVGPTWRSRPHHTRDFPQQKIPNPGCRIGKKSAPGGERLHRECRLSIIITSPPSTIDTFRDDRLPAKLLIKIDGGDVKTLDAEFRVWNATNIAYVVEGRPESCNWRHW